ncbi:MAG: formylglycine-generating enzyme family protein [Anaerolineae bacterium]|nr:formylglycine-generating enzyme family protein [Anaerolineae bacterium]
MELNRVALNEIVDLLAPLMESEQARRALLIQALVGEPLLDKIKWEGTPHEFVVVVVYQLATYGETRSGQEALWALLETARVHLGRDKQRRIDALYALFNRPRAMLPVERAPARVRLSFEPEWCTIPAGPFVMGSDFEQDPGAYDDENPRHEVNIPYAYHIGKYPVTVAEFRAFVEGDGYTNPAYWTEAGWAWRAEENRTQPDWWGEPGWCFDDHPVVGVSWYEAHAYCRWLGACLGREVRLPTEAEWEKAARGVDGRIYPWGDAFDKNKCNSDESGIDQTTPVGAYSPAGDSPYGCADMAGNVWEWCLSVHRDYPYNPSDGRNDVDIAGNRALRGGSFISYRWLVRTALRGRSVPGYLSGDWGFRVVAPAGGAV